MIKVKEVYSFIDELAPFDTQEPWDNSGFLVGDGENKVNKILCALDATADVIDEAERIGANLIVTHHPVIFGTLSEFHPDSIAYIAATKGISIISAHTCLDKAEGGVNDALAQALELKHIKKCSDEMGLLRVGKLNNEMNLKDFLAYVSEKLGCGGLKYTSTDKEICNVAVGGGSCAEFYKEAFESGADAFITANIKHNYFIDFKRYGYCVIDAGHFCTENVVIKPLADKISKRFENLEVVCSSVSKDPAEYWTK